jgi:disulfide bond formation protein DsbB
MVLAASSPASQHAYRAGAFALVVAGVTILAALAFEHLGGYVPCPLCLQQRFAYYAAVPLLFIALVLLSAGLPRAAALLFVLVSLAFLANAALGVYHAGAEWKYWPGPQSCAGPQELATTAGSLIESLPGSRVVRCDEAAWRFAGLSFAGWNVVVSLALLVISLRAAVLATRPQ